ncbi:MAG: hypothetical protein JWN95_3464 [Frankiales bacterium]|nr:hypothetical protein [Frankiales bacterium]
MQSVQLDWHQTAVLTVGLAGAGIATARALTGWRAKVAPYLRETAIIAGLYTLWQLAGSVSFLGSGDAISRGQTLLRWERLVDLPSEARVQRLIDGHSLIEQACNVYYAVMHFTGLGIFLVWLFIRHRDRYPFVRNVLAALTAACLLLQLIPVAPPRLLPGGGFIDTAAIHGQSMYNQSLLTVDQLAAMPSVHVGWSVLLAWAVITVSSSRYRWWIVAHPAITVFVVVATANHYWADGIVAVALLVASILAVRLVTTLSRDQVGGRVRVNAVTPAEVAPEM